MDKRHLYSLTKADLIQRLQALEIDLAGLREGYPAAIIPARTTGCAASPMMLVDTVQGDTTLGYWFYANSQWRELYSGNVLDVARWWMLPGANND